MERANNIKAELARYGLKYEDLAAELQLSIVTIGHKLSGKSPWFLHEAAQVVNYFNSMGGQHTVESLFFDRVAQNPK